MLDFPYAIKLSGVYKQYRLGQIGGSTLRGDLSSWWAKKRGKEDPNTKVGSVQRIQGSTFMALNGIDLTINPGEAIGIIGRNGAGKSTLLKLLSRVTAPTEGEIDIYGRVSSMLEVGTGFNKEMTGRENIYMNGAILGMTKAEIDAKIEQIIDFSEVREFIDTPVKRYSSGMYVKLAFSVAAHLDSEIMIMDEVLAVGDIAFQRKCLSRMKEIAETEHKTILYVSHSMNTIRDLCSRVIVLDEGKVVFDGDTETAISFYTNSKSSLKYKKQYGLRDYMVKNNCIVQVESTELNHADCQYPMGTDMEVKVVYYCERPIDRLHFRLQILSQDGYRVGSTFSSNGINAQAKTKSMLTLVVPTKELSPGIYTAELVFFRRTPEGAEQYINAIKTGFQFEVIYSANQINSLAWFPSWGKVQLSDMYIKE